ncbi:unnamed protein product, partial [Sphacelaria rigidula]
MKLRMPLPEPTRGTNLNPWGTLPSHPRSRRLIISSADKERKMGKENTVNNHFHGGRPQKNPPAYIMLAPKMSPRCDRISFYRMKGRNGSSTFTFVLAVETSTTC